jgi:hypothetical protein
MKKRAWGRRGGVGEDAHGKDGGEGLGSESVIVVFDVVTEAMRRKANSLVGSGAGRSGVTWG